ncbi:hypothetical protein IU498_05390 [Nocardia beijingensis]|uniref:hypothetical protein n=1 Tax=Nocardia beijingensis TaxID=95162 RepID=UPI001895373E|nr:hypothetical protein [Nocardia beijingensis]MBF6074062.1 hypothetical protein [Nocardia beijingensis]
MTSPVTHTGRAGDCRTCARLGNADSARLSSECGDRVLPQSAAVRAKVLRFALCSDRFPASGVERTPMSTPESANTDGQPRQPGHRSQRAQRPHDNRRTDQSHVDNRERIPQKTPQLGIMLI